MKNTLIIGFTLLVTINVLGSSCRPTRMRATKKVQSDTTGGSHQDTLSMKSNK